MNFYDRWVLPPILDLVMRLFSFKLVSDQFLIGSGVVSPPLGH